MVGKSGIFIGRNKGFVVTKPDLSLRKKRPVLRKGKLNKRVQVIREVIREVAGFTPLERKMRELIKTGVASKEKKAVKLARRRLGGHKRAMHKREEMNNLIAKERKRQH
jgi:large subunit ribosomal protein L36e